MTVLVFGPLGSGKTTWVQSQLGNGICYDLYYISGALRLTGPHKERHKFSREIANHLLSEILDFTGAQDEFNLFVIRCAPTVEELEDIGPDLVVEITGRHDVSNRPDYVEDQKQPVESAWIKSWCRENRIRFISPP